MNRFFKKCVSITFFLTASAAGLFAQHFTFTSSTGNDMTVAVPTSINPTIDGSALENGDEIGVFTPAGLCVGATDWDGVNNKAITVWGDDDQTTETDGISAGEALNFRVWDASRSLEIPADVSYTTGGPDYSVGGIAALSSLTASTYTVTYSGNGNTGGSVPVDGNSYPQGSIVTVLDNTGDLAKSGSTFTGWNTAADGSGTGYAGETTFTMSSSNVTLYAQWEVIAYTLSIAHVNGSEDPVTDKDTTVNHGDTVRVTAPPISGSDFIKWRITAGKAVLVDSTAQPAEVILTDGDATLTAIYEIPTVIVNRQRALPTAFDLSYIGSSSIRIAVPRLDGYCSVPVKIRLYDPRGRLLSTLVDKEMQAGYHTVKLTSGNNALLTWGVCRMDAEKFSKTVKILLLK
jgi:uncharacterized repeat protein (TIGR02543 family)